MGELIGSLFMLGGAIFLFSAGLGVLAVARYLEKGF
jgi:multisubunit Na+/H+ antiporter MnhG subunit